MNHPMPTRTPWSATSFVDATGLPTFELDALGQHLLQCSRTRSRWFVLGCGLDSLHRSLLARFVTSLALVVAVAGTTVLVW